MHGLSAALTIYFYVLAALLGLVMGSFLNCFAYRYAHGESVAKGRSKCALCGHTLSAKDLFPVFSYIFLRGKCRYCGKKLPASYVIAELICAAAYISVLALYGITFTALKLLVFVSLLFTAAFTDLYSGLIPNRIIIIGIINAVVFSFIPFGAPFSAALHNLLHTLLNGLSVSLPLLLLTLIFEKITKKDAMGGGDIKLIFMIGLYFDWKLNLLILIIACILGLAFALLFLRGKNEDEAEEQAEGGAAEEAHEEECQKNAPAAGHPFAFAPALCAAAWFAMLFGQPLVSWYLSLFFG